MTNCCLNALIQLFDIIKSDITGVIILQSVLYYKILPCSFVSLHKEGLCILHFHLEANWVYISLVSLEKAVHDHRSWIHPRINFTIVKPLIIESFILIFVFNYVYRLMWYCISFSYSICFIFHQNTVEYLMPIFLKQVPLYASSSKCFQNLLIKNVSLPQKLHLQNLQDHQKHSLYQYD